MKTIVILGDGMADYPLQELDNLTPLQYAATPNMDRLACKSQLGTVKTVPAGYSPGSDVANLSVIGYDPKLYYTGRSPLEAVSMGIELGDMDVTLRCNLVTLSEEEPYENKKMVDYCAGEISSEEAEKLISLINTHCSREDIVFYPGISYRHLMLWKNGTVDLNTTPPHDIADKIIAPYLPQGDGATLLVDLMRQSNELLANHSLNKERENNGKHPANSIWLWGQGTKPQMPPFKELYGLDGAMISAVDLTKGIALCIGLAVVNVPGATGNIHTNFSGKARAALETLSEGADFVYIHVEAPDEAGHQGNIEDKVKAIEAIDKQVLGEIISGMESIDNYRLMLLPDHPTPISLRTHTNEPVPFMIYNSKYPKSGRRAFDEAAAAATGFHIEEGHKLMEHFLK
ncbi:MAG: cofactor-independent phosphoglycerate mutase [Thermoanaerobacteraceae bacterium]|nr:cofactor-independent phosphoglycerate mutase [Thermoanaerobacteraceae bacterium]